MAIMIAAASDACVYTIHNSVLEFGGSDEICHVP